MKKIINLDSFESTFHFAAIGMALVAPDGKFLRVNRTLCKFLGYTEDELLKLDFQNLTHPDDRKAATQLAEKLLRGVVESYRREKRYVRKDKKIVWGLLSVSVVRNAEGDPLYFISQVQDISDLKENEAVLFHRNEELKHQQTQLATVIESMNALVIEILPTGKIRNLWKKSPRITFYTEWPLAKDEIVYAGLPRALGQSISSAVFKTIVSHELQVVEMKVQEHKSYWLQARVSPVLNEQKKITSIILMISDISKLKKTQEQLIQSSKLSSLGEMAAGIAHEINNPLAIILGSTQLLRKNLANETLQLPNRILSHLDSIHGTAERIAAIVRGLRIFSRNAEGDSKEPTDLV
jgi:PAS domain S-box-containing protein